MKLQEILARVETNPGFTKRQNQHRGKKIRAHYTRFRDSLSTVTETKVPNYGRCYENEIKDPVYIAAGDDMRERIQRRKLTETEYNSILITVQTYGLNQDPDLVKKVIETDERGRAIELDEERFLTGRSSRSPSLDRIEGSWPIDESDH